MPRIGIIGSGFGAIAVAAEFLRHGYRDIRLWERADALGGVWRDNTYPGAACDVPSPFYSFSWAPSASWNRRYAEQPDILRYLRGVADREGVTPRTRLGVSVVAAQWTGAAWTVTLDTGETDEIDLLVPAVGQLSNPVIPAIAGADSFGGPAFHTARWPEDLDLASARVAVIGAAATAVQVVPKLAVTARQVTLFQRTPSYIWPKPDAVYPPWYRRFAARAERPFFRALGEASRRRPRLRDRIRHAVLSPGHPHHRAG